MRAKKFISFTICAMLCMQILPVTLAVEATGDALEKAPGYQEFPAYYSDSHHADDQVTHPDVVVMDETWNGYRYWAVYTPNVMRTSIYENPSIVASNDGVNWIEPEGLVNPIEGEPSSTRYHNCDADMIYNAKMDAMMAYWNWADDQAGGVGAEVRLRISYDGIHWGVPVTYDEETRIWTAPTSEEERQVASGPQDYIMSIHSQNRYDMLSPTFVYDDYRNTFIMWANNAGNIGYQNGQNNYVRMWYSDDGITWGDPVRVNNFLGLDAEGNQLAPWHQDVQYISELKEFLALSQCFAGANPDGSVLHLTKSKDGVNWQQVGTLPLLSPGPDGSWDDFQIYRSCFYYEPGTVAGNGTMRVWYSALQKNTNNKMVADSEGNLTIQAKDQDDRIWRIGYAENDYASMMRVLLEDPSYTVPALVAGESLTLTPNVQGDSIFEGEQVKLQAVFAPADTSNQIVKFTTSDPDIATVDNFGIITAIREGEVTISGQTEEGLTTSITYTVKKNPSKLIPQAQMTATATSEHSGTEEGPASNVLDGNSSTIWHTKYNPQDPLPQSLTVSFEQAKTVNQYVYTPRQVGTNGMVTMYELYAVKADGTKELVARGDWAADTSDKAVRFAPVEAVALELKVVEGAGGFGTAAEINVYEYVGSEEVIVDAMNTSLVYTGSWNDDHNSAFYGGNARYADSASASVALTFTGTAVRWYGQKDINFGTAEVYMDDELVDVVNVNGTMAIGQLLFERTGLTAGEHTIRIVCVTPVIDLDYFSYTIGI
uniref:discoidin domain-containing protein n=1 Tax=Candidatus Fimivicinus sp. TaxID=3056640 RepID=UPI003FF07214